MYKSGVKKSRRNKIVLSAIVVIAIGISALIFWRVNNQSGGEKALKQALSRVGKLVILPTDEKPTLATVEDSSKVSDPLLKAQAQNGDQLLIYYNAKKIYLYRPSQGKVVDIQPLILDPSAAQANNSKIIVRQGNGKPETGESIRRELDESFPSTEISLAGNAARQDYPMTIIIDLTDGQKYDLVSALVTSTGAQRGILPSGEPKPEGADILIITGTDR
jgi:hypothetical protein